MIINLTTTTINISKSNEAKSSKFDIKTIL